MSIPIHINVIWDPTLGMNAHTYWSGPPVPNTPTFAFEMIATQMWTAGYLLGQNKFTKKTNHKGVPICIDDHDIGILIPDITIPFVNSYYCIMWPFSGRKMTFTCSKVKMEGKPTSCSQLLPIPMPMMTCGDPLTLPTAFPIINSFNNVIVGMTIADLVLGIIKIAVSVAIDAIFEWGPVANLFKKSGADEAVKKLGQALMGEALGKLGLSPKALAKKAVSALAGFAFSAYEGNPTLKIGVGGGPLPEIGVQAGGEKSGVTTGNDPLGILPSTTP